ncbi:hypothetical protein ABOM_000671 [Aspergillus bombycis]|uniref:Uncharacterized protein n=1 Tax=Aspergillus bombycis TaxID=109264 RepID=A0A1F8AGI6_9EURO|nr:hypothetical protein ABOM_000671 [Aspergillus bombycis]OGM50801.1 hypothetical protein ABOM_000671 [Aspergillus bombycis]
MRQTFVIIALFLAGFAACQGAAGSSEEEMPGSYPESPPGSPKPGHKADVDKSQPPLSRKALLEKRCRKISARDLPRYDDAGSVYVYLDVICTNDPKNDPDHNKGALWRSRDKPIEQISSVNLDWFLGWDKTKGGPLTGNEYVHFLGSVLEILPNGRIGFDTRDFRAR